LKTKKTVVVAIIILLSMLISSFALYQHIQNQIDAEMVKDDVDKIKKYIESQKRELSTAG